MEETIESNLPNESNNIGSEAVIKIGRLKIKKRFIVAIGLPIVILTLLLIGLIKQGYLADWLGYQADLTLTALNQKQEPVQSAQVILQDQTTTTNDQGKATLTGLKLGRYQLIIRRTGYVESTQDITLKRGANDLGSIILTETPAEKVSFVLTIKDYVSEKNIQDALITLKDLRPIKKGESWEFVDVTFGDYELTIEKQGYNTYKSDITVTKDTTELELVNLVPEGRIVFGSNRERGLNSIYTAAYDGSGQKPLISRVGDYEDFSPSLGPSQRKVFFYSTRDGIKNDDGRYKNALYVVNLDGSNLIKIAEDALPYDGLWSAGGQFIAFKTYDKTRGYILKLYDVIKKNTISFDDYTNFDSYAVSQDEKFVAFTARLSSEKTKLYIGSTDGSTTRLIDDKESWSLEFTSTGKLRYSTFDTKNRFYEYSLSTTAIAEISAPAIDRYIGAALSPNGKYRAYVSTRDGKSNLFVSDPDGKNEVQLTTLHFVQGGDILWSLDSSFIMFNIAMPGESARYLVPADNSAEPKKIVDVNTDSWYN